MNKNKKIILIIASLIIIIGGVFVFEGLMKNDLPGFALEKVLRGNVEQEIVETGKVEAGEKMKLSFKSMGRIEMLEVKVGDTIKSGQVLAKIDDTQLLIQLNEAKIGLELAEIGLSRLKAGASEEEIRLAQTAVDNAEISLLNAQQGLEDIKIQSTNNLNQAYENALNNLTAVFLIIDSSFNTADFIQRRYFTTNDQEGIRVRIQREVIKKAKEEVKSYLEIAQNNPTKENIKTALLKTKERLERISDALVVIRATCDESIYRHLVSDVDRASIDVQRNHLTTGLTNIINTQQAIDSTELTNSSNIQIAQTKINSFEGQLKSAKNTLTIKKAGPRQIDIDLHQAQINQAQNRITLLEEQIKETILKAPVSGKIVEVFKEKEEIIQPTEPLIALFPIAPFQVGVDIYEEDIAKVKIGNPVEINLIAFPEQPLKGKVVLIKPTEKLIGGVVHYETIIAFIDELPKGVRSGMTTDIIIQTDFRENVLIISEEAIEQDENNNFIVSVYKDGIITERVVKIGLRGKDDKVEVISGLEQGETVVIK